MKKIGIYKIENTINKKVYIGQSNNILIRFSNHKYELNSNKHSNSHLQRAWNKYGRENFIFDILCECNTGCSKILARERKARWKRKHKNL